MGDVLQVGSYQPSAKVTEKIEEAAELAADFNLDDQDDELLTLNDAMVKLNVSHQSLRNWISEQAIPSEKHGARRYIRMSVCETINELREIHGSKNWKQHATWSHPDEEPWSPGEEETSEETSSGTSFTPSEILERAKQARLDGRNEASAELFDLLCSKFSFEGEG